MEIFRSQRALGDADKVTAPARRAGLIGDAAARRRAVRSVRWHDPPDWVRDASRHAATRQCAWARRRWRFRAGRLRLARAARTWPASVSRWISRPPGTCARAVVLEEGASLTLVEGVGDLERFPQYRHRNRARATTPSSTHVRIAPAAPDAVQVEEIAATVARDGSLSRPFRQFRRQAVAPGTGDRAGRRGRRGASLRCQRAGRRRACRRHHPCHPRRRQHAAARSCSRTSRAASRAPSIRARSRWRKGANGSDSRQTAKALLLGDARRSRSEARTGNLRRRREMRPWRGGRRSGCGFAVLSARPRHSGSRSAQPADARLPGRRGRRNRRRRHPRDGLAARSKTRCRRR